MSSYRLESPRPRPPPPPIRIRSPGHIPSSLSSPTTLLYDLPQSSRSPPPLPSSQTNSEAIFHAPPSPKSPTLVTPATPRPPSRQTPPPRPRNTTPGHTPRQEFDQFTSLCRAFYFEQNERAGQLMTQTLETLDASQRPAFSRLQASVRSAYHVHMAKRRRTEFRAHLSSTYPGGSLSPSSRANPSGKAAKKERYDRFSLFLRTWCISGMPGPRPFFQGLWAMLRLQVLPADLGGAGPRRIEWECDDAVFQESAGKEFMMEAVDVLKGVLGFEEYVPLRSPRSSYHSDEPSAPVSTRIPLTRPRSPSDPFLDTPALSRSIATSSSQSGTLHGHPRLPSDDSADNNEGTETTKKATTFVQPFRPDDDQPHLRVWITPELDNPELQALVSLFPNFISKQSLPRFPLNQTRTRRNEQTLEEGLADMTGERKEVSCGTGRIWVGEKLRHGYRGSWWHRFTQWWGRLFC